MVSDKLTRNSFPKGYTKNLEKKLLDVELNRNQLLLELNSLKQKIAHLEANKNNNNSNKNMNENTVNGNSITAINNSDKDNSKNSNKQKGHDLNDEIHPANSRCCGTDSMTIDSDMIYTLSYSHQNNSTDQNLNSDIYNDKSASATPKELKSYSLDLNRKDHYFHKQIKTNQSGLLILDQNLKSPFESIFSNLKSNPFKGYANNAALMTHSASVSSVSSNSHTQSNLNSNSALNDLSPSALKNLTNYHMNLNRYLNLILYKLIFPLFNLDSKLSPHNASLSSNDSNKNLDHLIWLFFNDYNKLIPILDFELFYNDYLTFVNVYTLKNSTYIDNGEVKKRYYEFNSKDQDVLIKLVLILKFTLCQPKIDENNQSSAFLPDKSALNQLDESIKLINVKHLIMMFRNINFCLSPNLDKLEISLLFFYYLIKFENYNLPNYTDSLHSHKEFLLDVINLNTNLVNTLHINKSTDLLISNKVQNKQLTDLQRLKLYWNYKILIKLSEIYFNIPLADDEFEINSNNYNHDEPKLLPESLESIVLINNDIKITLCLVKLLKLIPWNIMQFVQDKKIDVLSKIDKRLSDWKKAVENLYNEDNSVVFNKLKSYYLYFKVLVNVNEAIDPSYFIDFINLVYDLTFNNSKFSYKKHEVSIEAAESLCLHSFNFHFVTLISITSLKGDQDKTVCQKIYKLIQLYQILINYKDVDPAITIFVNYIKENILYAFSDASSIQEDTLKLFSSVDLDRPKNTSLFDKKILQNSSKSLNQQQQQQQQQNKQMNFDLNAFNLPGDSCYSNDDNTSNKRRKSATSTSSVLSSNMSLTSRESSIVSSSRRLSCSSNDSMPSLFPSATSPYHNQTSNNISSFPMNNSSSEITASAKKRIMDYAIQPVRTTLNRSRSLSADSRIRSSRGIDRRLSGSISSNGYPVSRENSLDATMLSNRNSVDDNMSISNSVDDEILSHILSSDVDSEVDSEMHMILANNNNNNTTANNNNNNTSSSSNKNSTGKANSFKSSNFKPNINLLPTIPSEGNLMKIMGVLDTTSLDPLKKNLENGNSDFDVDSLFSVTNDTVSNILEFKNNQHNSISAESNTVKSKISDFSRAFRKSPSSKGTGSISSAFNNNTTNLIRTNFDLPGTVKSENGVIDDDDLLRLKEHVLNMKSSMN